MNRLLLLLLCCLPSAAFAEDDDYSAEVRSKILPWVESTGQLFGLTQEGFDALAWDAAYLESCPHEAFQRMLAVTENPEYCHVPSGYYRLHSDRGGYLYLEGSNPQTSDASSLQTALSSLVKVERTRDGGCYLQMQGYYLHTPQRDIPLSLDSVPEKFYPVVQTPGGKATFTTRKGAYSALHCGYSKVQGYTLSDAASYWTVEPAADFTLSASVQHEGYGYATFYAACGATPRDGVAAYDLAEHEGRAVATEQLEVVPAKKPVLLRAAGGTMTMDIADVVPEYAQGNIVLRNEIADASYEAFNAAYLLYSGDGNSNYTYYRERLSTKSKLYFWQQALVILMVEDRHDYRGDRSTVSLITDLLDAFSAQEGGSGNGTAESLDARRRGLSDWTWNEYNDDLLWAGLAYIRGYLITGHKRFLEQAKWAWDFMYARGWDEELGGGIWWSIKKEEKSGLSNNPAVCMACYLYDATGDVSYLDKAKAIYAWVCKRLRSSDGSVDEKINANGVRPRSYNVYNQGTFVEGAANLYRLTGDAAYRTDARKTIEYVLINHVDGKGIMTRRKTDGTWQSEFARGMAAHLRACPDDWSRRCYYTTSRQHTTYYNWMRKNADAAWATRNAESNLSDCEWDKPTEAIPSEGNSWECDVMAGTVVMANVTPEVLPGSGGETYVDLDGHGMAAAAPSEPEPAATSPSLLHGAMLKTTEARSTRAVLKNGSRGMGFYPITAATSVGANSGYVLSSSQLPLDLSSLDSPLTGFRGIEADVPDREATAARYDLAGRRLSGRGGWHGIVISQGHKAVGGR